MQPQNNISPPCPVLSPTTANHPNRPWRPKGLLRYCDRRIPFYVLRRAYKIIFDIPFNSANKWAITVTQCPGARGERRGRGGAIVFEGAVLPTQPPF
jgi:hypothetical protein